MTNAVFTLKDGTHKYRWNIRKYWATVKSNRAMEIMRTKSTADYEKEH
jgi:hypothetical protein